MTRVITDINDFPCFLPIHLTENVIVFVVIVVVAVLVVLQLQPLLLLLLLLLRLRVLLQCRHSKKHGKSLMSVIMFAIVDDKTMESH